MKCTVTGQEMTECEHCLDPNYIELDDDGPEYETVGRPFKSQFRGVCTIEYRHSNKRGDLVARVRRADNPNILIGGVACKNCTLMLPRGKK